MLGNLMKESGVVDRINKTAGNELMNIITIFLGVSVGCTTSADTFFNLQTAYIIALGLLAFCFGTAGGVLLGRVMCWVTKGQVNPLIGSAGVSAVPMAARVSQKVGQKENPQNFLLMHAMGPNVAGEMCIRDSLHSQTYSFGSLGAVPSTLLKETCLSANLVL